MPGQLPGGQTGAENLKGRKRASVLWKTDMPEAQACRYLGSYESEEMHGWPICDGDVMQMEPKARHQPAINTSSQRQDKQQADGKQGAPDVLGRPSIRGCFAYGLVLCLRPRCFLRLLLFCTCPLLCAGALWPMPAWVWRDVRFFL